jgi:hypothetical protein
MKGTAERRREAGAGGPWNVIIICTKYACTVRVLKMSLGTFDDLS